MKIKALGSDRESGTETWQTDQLETNFYGNELRKLLSSDPLLKILKTKLIRLPRGPVSAPMETSNQLEAILRLMKQLDAEFSAEDFNTQTLLEYNNFQVIHAGRSLFVKLVPLFGRRG